MPVTTGPSRPERLFDSISSERSWAIRTRVFHYRACLCDSWESCTAILHHENGKLLAQFQQEGQQLTMNLRSLIRSDAGENFVKFLRVTVHPGEAGRGLVECPPLDPVHVEELAQGEPATLF